MSLKDHLMGWWDIDKGEIHNTLWKDMEKKHCSNEQCIFHKEDLIWNGKSLKMEHWRGIGWLCPNCAHQKRCEKKKSIAVGNQS